MAFKINNQECVLCGACEQACPNKAIYEPGAEWNFADGTTMAGLVAKLDGTIVDANERQGPLSYETWYIVPDKCTECQGFHEEPQCSAVCCVDCCIPDEMYRETVEELLAKKEKLHN